MEGNNVLFELLFFTREQALGNRIQYWNPGYSHASIITIVKGLTITNVLCTITCSPDGVSQTLSRSTGEKQGFIALVCILYVRHTKIYV